MRLLRKMLRSLDARSMKAWSILFAICMSANAQMVEVYNIFGKQDDSTWKYPAKQLFISGGYAGRWLTIVRFDTTAPEQHGFDPSFTYVISKFKPVARQLKNGDWEIHFECSICEALP